MIGKQSLNENLIARLRRRRAIVLAKIYLCLIPGFIFLLIFSYYPFFSAFFYSLYKWDGANLSYIGFQNFINIASDERLIPSIVNISILTGTSIIYLLTFPLMAAVFIHNLKHFKWQNIYRFLFTIPLVIPWVVTILVWAFLYDPIDGPINRFLISLGLQHYTRAWLADFDITIWALTMIGGAGSGTGVGFPFVSGMNLLIYLAGLNNISKEVKESAFIAGASGWQMFRFIELPLIKTQIRINIFFTIISQLQAFQTVILLTRGGPGYSTMVPGMAMYQDAFDFSRMGYASAIGVVLFVIMLIFTLFINQRLKSETDFDPNK